MGARENIARLLMGKPGGPTPEGIRVYHSSPHDFDKFDLSKLRTGEGANMYGSGFYFAENPAVSGQGGQYWNQFLNKFPKQDMRMAEILKQHAFDREATIAELERQMEGAKRRAQGSPGDFHRDAIEMFQQKIDHLRSGAPVGPRTYEVNIKAKPEELLDWDKPVNLQKQVQERLAVEPDHWGHYPTGKELYQRLSASAVPEKFLLDYGAKREGAQIASQQLNEAGIPGIRYLDQGSRNMYGAHQGMIDNYGSREAALANAQKRLASGMGDPEHYRSAIEVLSKPQSYNYVGFDPSKLDIMAKYGIAGAPAGLALGNMFDQGAYAATPDTFDQRWGQQ